MFDIHDDVYLILIEKRNRLDKHTEDTIEKASKMEHIDGFSSKWAFIAAIRAEHEEMRAELTQAIENRIEELKK